LVGTDKVGMQYLDGTKLEDKDLAPGLVVATTQPTKQLKTTLVGVVLLSVRINHTTPHHTTTTSDVITF
jgi:hypothetical protein